MRKRIIWLILSFLMALSLVLASCTTTTEEEEEEEGVVVEEEEEEEEEGGPPVGGDWWDKFGEPEYGGTITYRMAGQTPGFDNISFAGGGQQYWFERLWTNDWTLDRDIWSFNTNFTPDEYHVGLLAESWEMPDTQTIIVHIRQGVHWQDKPPVNGREFTADDVEYHYDRMMGTGHGFTEPSHYYVGLIANWEKVTATDKYTVVFKFKEPTAFGLSSLLDPVALNTFEAREWVEQGDLQNWKNAVGTGPWILTDFIKSNLITFSRNPNYWGHDERYPENQVPYADKLKLMIIPDIATALAALRTGKIDILDQISWEQADSLLRTNPELLQAELPSAGISLAFRCDREPFTDINVRKALQMAIDRELIAETYYGGTVDGTPCGELSPEFTGYCFAYEDWPQELKDEYGYDPTKAKQLLNEAGYPDGFKTNIVTNAVQSDLDLLQIISSQFLEIDVDMDIKVMDMTAYRAFLSAGNHDQMFDYASCGSTFPPNNTLWKLHSEEVSYNFTYNNDSGYDALLGNIETATDPAEVKRLIVEADRYALEKHWSVNLFPTIKYNVYQPYFKGYSGEAACTIASWGQQHMWARLWIDQDFKVSMGR